MAKRNMTATEYRATLKRLGLNQSSAAKLFRIPLRTSARWAAFGLPRWASVCIRAFLAGKISEDELRGKFAEE
jgi:hypothetical protein